MNLPIFLSKMLVCSAVLFGYYWLFLRNQPFHRYNRIYLLLLVAISLLLPFLNIPLEFEQANAGGQAFAKAVDAIRVGEWNEITIDEASPEDSGTWFTAPHLAMLFYLIVSVLLLLVLFQGLLYIRRIKKQYPHRQLGKIRFYDTVEPGTPFSYFRSIFWYRDIPLHEKEGRQIFRHELFHVTEKHSVDNLLLELVCALAWFNPVFHLVRKELKAIHEFLADNYACSQSDRYAYAETLLQQSIQRKKTNLVNPFFHNQIKRRIAMITHFKNRPASYRSRIWVLPVAALLFFAVAFTTRHHSNPAHAQELSPGQISSSRDEAPFTVMIDAGHGGRDAGARTADGQIAEKDIALAIAKKIEQHASDYHIRVLMTRENDDYPELKERTLLAEKRRPDLFVSIHVAADQSASANAPNSGIEVYVSNRNLTYQEKSKVLGNLLLESFKTIYQVQEPVKQRAASGIWVLDKAPCPAVLIECGYITNANDLQFVQSAESQDKIARSILQGLKNYTDKQRESTAFKN